jgi:hypothetical protein
VVTVNVPETIPAGAADGVRAVVAFQPAGTPALKSNVDAPHPQLSLLRTDTEYVALPPAAV